MVYLTIKEKEKITPDQRSDIIRKIQQYRSVEDAVALVFALFDEEETTEITANDFALHTAFFKLKAEHPSLLGDLSFTCGQIFPYSIDLQRAIFNLQRSDLLEAPNPTYEYHLLKKTSKETIKTGLLKLFSDKEQAELAEISKELKASIEYRAIDADKCVC